MQTLKIKNSKYKRCDPKNRYFLQLETQDGYSYFPTYNQLFKAPSGMFAAKVDPKDAPWTEFIIISGGLPDDKLINTYDMPNLMASQTLEEHEKGI